MTLAPETAPPPTVPVPAVEGTAVEGTAVQGTLDELGRDLSGITFCVVDLETTGGSAAAGSMITEIGAVKVRGGEVLGEFQTLVDPEGPIPTFITVLTGITDAMVVAAPRIGEALPSFLEFARGTVLVAHNAPFDVGFLKHFTQHLGLAWPGFETLDTARIARRVLLRDEVPNCKLSTLARHFHAATTPNHRALADARATVDVLHALLERLGTMGVSTMEELATFSSRVSPAQRKKSRLADHLPHLPGVYLFRDRHENVLYVGTSKDLRARVRSYFTSSETRTRMGEMVALATRVEGITCATALEAQVRELRLIAHHKPPYNRRSRHPERATWIKLTREPWPRLSFVRKTDDDADYLGPFTRRSSAERVAATLYEAFRIRQCSGRLPRRPSRSACALAEMGSCLAPCDGTATPETYAAEVDRVRTALTLDPTVVVDASTDRMRTLSGQGRFEDAAHERDRLVALVRATHRSQRLAALLSCAEVVAARPLDPQWREWEVHVVRHGRLVASGVMPASTPSGPWVEALRSTAETIVPDETPAATAAESELVLRWLESDGVRLVDLDGEWASPVRGAGRHLPIVEAAERSRAAAAPFDEARGEGWRTEHRPRR
ncbi:DEDD exonuclease domain-containing protein [Mumia sp. zg.B53]|uniref:DEDD exonuclease domain-containing protein n=2 Tax=unclassified Mumia TaxID=2621872 RepID=UPI001C6E6237|nr:DEDD exonuclease domain-containing protein [Mumia sp. zg.B53]MBW9216595.1 DEDD exonuclease domain-containing protein [Mumia sp. zg.B53]